MAMQDRALRAGRHSSLSEAPPRCRPQGAGGWGEEGSAGRGHFPFPVSSLNVRD